MSEALGGVLGSFPRHCIENAQGVHITHQRCPKNNVHRRSHIFSPQLHTPLLHAFHYVSLREKDAPRFIAQQ